MLIFLCGTALAAVLARLAARLPVRAQTILIAVLAVLLPGSEACKQLLLFLSNHGAYNWWYFPFQLCSMPLYLLPLWLLLPAKYKALRQGLSSFLVDFGLLGGVFAFADQSGMHYALSILTLHSYLWHFLMIFLGLYFCFTRKNSTRPKDFLLPGALFLLFAGIATGFNLAFHDRGLINMFYISPYIPMQQLVFRDIARITGQLQGRLIYLCSILLGAFLIHLCCARLTLRRSSHQ